MFGERLSYIIKTNGYTQRQLAKELNISPSAINYWIKNKREPDIENIISISKIFNITSDYLLGLTNDPINETTVALSQNEDPLLQKIIDTWSSLNESNKHRLYADCMDYIAKQKSAGKATDKEKKQRVISPNSDPVQSKAI